MLSDDQPYMELQKGFCWCKKYYFQSYFQWRDSVVCNTRKIIPLYQKTKIIHDANGTKPWARGIFCCHPTDIGNPNAHTKLFDPKYEASTLIIEDGVILATHIAVASPFTLGIMISTDLGKTWFEYDIKDFVPFSPSRIHKKNSEGWFRFDLRTGWIDRAEYMFLKPK